MFSTFNKLKTKICDITNRQYCVLTGRATTGIFLVLKAVGADNGDVVFPANLCPSPVNAALYSNCQPVFCDVKSDDATMAPASLKRALTDRTRAVIPVHLYGHPAEMDKIESTAAVRNIPVIEDVAQAIGGYYNDRPLGSFGLASVLSFGYSKIIDAGEGGAVVTDDLQLAMDLEKMLSTLPEKTLAISRKTALYSNLYKKVVAAANEDLSLNMLLYQFPEVFKDIFLYKLSTSQAEIILSKLDCLDSELGRRRENFAVYKETLLHPDIVHFNPLPGVAPWRYSVLIHGSKRQKAVDTLLENRLDVSCWYPTIYNRYPQKEITEMNNAELIGANVINLWVNKDLSTTRKTADCLLASLN